jgi:hypothetical protein
MGADLDSVVTEHIMPLLMQPKYRVAAYFGGHAHCLSYKRFYNGAYNVDFFLSGGGGRVDCQYNDPDNICTGTQPMSLSIASCVRLTILLVTVVLNRMHVRPQW